MTYREILKRNMPIDFCDEDRLGDTNEQCFWLWDVRDNKYAEDYVRVTRTESETFVDDDWSVCAVKDGNKILVKAPNVVSYSIKEDVCQLAEEAFVGCTKLVNLDVPYTVNDYSLYRAMEHLPNKDNMDITLWDWPRDCRISDEMIRDIDEGWTDEQGFTYSKDRKRLLRAAPKVDVYWIPEGVERIEQLAFSGCRFETLHVPYTCRIDDLAEEEYPIFGSDRVSGCVLTWDRPYAEQDYVDDSLLVADDDMVVDADGVVYTKNMKRLLLARMSLDEPETNIVNMEEYTVPDGVVTICDSAFTVCKEFLTLSVPRSIRVIGDSIFGEAGGRIVVRE